MERQGPVQVTLEIDSQREPITGWILTPASERRRFIGMLELIGLLEAARAHAGGEANGGRGA